MTMKGGRMELLTIYRTSSFVLPKSSAQICFRLSAVKPALDLLNNYLPYLPTRLALLMHFTLSYLDSLRHTNGKSIVQIHSPVPLLSKPNSEPDGLSSDRKPYSPQTHGAL